MPCPVGLPQVKDKADTHQGIAEKPGQNSRPGKGFQLLDVKSVNDSPQDKSPCCQRDRGYNVEGNPQTPGVRVVQIGCCTQAEDEPGQSRSRTGCNK
ncbi:MAG: hypothetical protein A4E65_02807 [Syntrophorhabdus sp. PtaU1.Bin153]|nr:MAG: hypothetical protein A4E63_00267 [Syntrophorhabdus sp. PtaU1.Bin050]OPY77287.1 MAG: hypothetical protein A4E65_02807 [Syntrophorhabdus sp. PtaU1.Bin153]